MTKKYTKSEQEIIDHITNVRSLKKTTKLHMRAILKLKNAGIIEKDPTTSVLRLVENEGIDMPTRATISQRWMSAIWQRYAGKKVIVAVAYGDTRAESLDRADLILETLKIKING